ncbi:MAG: hypothetical protein WED83_02235 [Acidimicrobiia bacterium]
MTMGAFTVGSMVAGATLTSLLGFAGGALVEFGNSAIWIAGVSLLWLRVLWT